MRRALFVIMDGKLLLIGSGRFSVDTKGEKALQKWAQKKLAKKKGK